MKKYQLAQKQSLPFNKKLEMSQRRIEQWYNHFNGNVYISYSGGLDSEVLLHLARSVYPSLPAVFINTPLEWLQRLAKFLTDEHPEKIKEGSVVDNAIRLIQEVYCKAEENLGS